MKKIIVFGLFMVMSVFLMSCVPRPGASPVGRATVPPAAVVATSCNGDAICEASTVSAGTVNTDKATVNGATTTNSLRINNMEISTNATNPAEMVIRNSSLVNSLMIEPHLRAKRVQTNAVEVIGLTATKDLTASRAISFNGANPGVSIDPIYYNDGSGFLVGPNGQTPLPPGNNYVCITSSGLLFKSSTPCQ